MSSELNDKTRATLVEYLLRLADDRLVLGHRLSEWCGHGPILEEDLALANAALDLIGQAQNFYSLAGEIEGKGRSADDFAYFRDEIDYRNCQFVELPRGDYAFTIARLFLFSAFSYLLFEELQKVEHEELAGLAARALKENAYHLRHAGQWMLRFGDGTDESHSRARKALDDLWMYTGELFEMDETDQILLENHLATNLAALRERWLTLIGDIIRQATLEKPSDDIYMQSGGRRGVHTEHLGHLLAEMQILARSHPGAEW
jgi:ring-1,2-phenylacetyl-CoA epoxidase subunit PaaC